MNHKQRATATADLELDCRDQIIAGLRDHGASYREIAKTLDISFRKVEASLGEIAVLRDAGRSFGEIGRVVGLPRSTVHDIAGAARRLSTERTQAALAGLSQMHGMQLDVLRLFLRMEKNHTYRLVKNLRESGFIYELEQVQPGEKWVVPTRVTAARYLGWRPKDWHPPLMFAEHYRAVAQARVMLVGSDPQLWVSERELRHRSENTADQAPRKKAQLEFSTSREPIAGRSHMHDGRFLGVVEGRHGWWALEVELSVKDPTHMDTALQGAIRAAVSDHNEPMVGLLYLCRSESVVNNVNAAAERLPREFAHLSLDLVIRDFDREWRRWLDRHTRQRTTEKAQSSNRGRSNLIQISKEAS